MSDLISRSALLEEIEKSMKLNPHNGKLENAMHDHEHKYFLCIVKRQPPVEAVPQWIPCSERMPEKKVGINVLVKIMIYGMQMELFVIYIGILK